MSGFRSRLRRGEELYGAFVNLRSADAAELLSRSGVDFLVVDQEHSALGPADVVAMIRAIEAGGASPLVRVPEIAPGPVQWALDAGAEGIVFPRIRSVADAAQAVSLCRYPPDGRRGLGPGRASGYGTAVAEYLARANETIAVVLQVETAEAVGELEAIVQLEGVDLLFIGPGDLSQALGVPMESTRFQETAERIVSVSRSAATPVGTLVTSNASLTFWKALRVPVLAVGSDASLLVDGLRSALDRARAL